VLNGEVADEGWIGRKGLGGLGGEGEDVCLGLRLGLGVLVLLLLDEGGELGEFLVEESGLETHLADELVVVLLERVGRCKRKGGRERGREMSGFLP
jgi:hypothetical protein